MPPAKRSRARTRTAATPAAKRGRGSKAATSAVRRNTARSSAHVPPARHPRTPRTRLGGQPRTLAIDIGGTGIKGSVLDREGRMLHDRVRIKTPKSLTPAKLVELIATLARGLPRFDRISVGFPGVVHDGVIRTAFNLGTERFRGFNLETALSKKLRRPARVANDADVQGLAVVRGKGVELVITLGTGFGTALFMNGRLAPHLELAHHCFHGGKTYEDILGDAAFKRQGAKRWGKHVEHAIKTLRDLVNFEHLYIGGGNAQNLEIDLPDDATIVDNKAGVLGGIRLWED